MTEQVQRSLGMRPTTQPWRQSTRRHIPQPPLRVGICLDVSVSMGRFLKPAASAAWTTAKATTWISDATTATVTFGAKVQAVTRAGQRPGHVPIFDLEPDTAGFCVAVDALDHELGLSATGHAARLLVIISDGHLPDADRAPAQTRLDRLARNGCGLLWITPPNAAPLTGARVITLTQPDRLGRHIADAATAALRPHP